MGNTISQGMVNVNVRGQIQDENTPLEIFSHCRAIFLSLHSAIIMLHNASMSRRILLWFISNIPQSATRIMVIIECSGISIKVLYNNELQVVKYIGES